jgi:hypothetical protein
MSDFGFILSQSPGNIGFEAAPFKLLPEYVEVLGGVEGIAYLEFRRLFREGFEAARKHCDRITSLSISMLNCGHFHSSLDALSFGGIDAERLVLSSFRVKC